MKQLEWAKWAAVDEIRRAEAQRVEVPTPRTPPEEIHPVSTGSTNSASPIRPVQSVAPSSPRAVTPPGLMSSPVITAAPVTPHKPRPTTPIKTDGPVPQPRKTPATKRAATGDEEIEDEGDQLGVLGVGFRRVSGKRVAGGDAGSASRSEGGSRLRRDAGVESSSKSDSGPRLPAGAMSVDRGKSTGLGLGRATRSSTRMVAKRAAEIEASIASAPTPPVGSSKPRLLSHATTANGKPGGVSHVSQATAALKNAAARGHGASSSVSSVPGNARRPAAPPGSPQLPKYNTRSRLPLPSAGALGPATNGALKLPQKRVYILTPPPPLPLPLPAEKGKQRDEAEKEKDDEDPDWMHGEGANAVVVPGSKSERPNLRSVRRRRSSFSAADIVT
jgi:cell division cycle 14